MNWLWFVLHLFVVGTFSSIYLVFFYVVRVQFNYNAKTWSSLELGGLFSRSIYFLTLISSPSSTFTAQVSPGSCSSNLWYSAITCMSILNPPHTTKTKVALRSSLALTSTSLCSKSGWYAGTRVVEQASSTRNLWPSRNHQKKLRAAHLQFHSLAKDSNVSMLNSSGILAVFIPPSLCRAILTIPAAGSDAPRDPDALEEKDWKCAK